MRVPVSTVGGEGLAGTPSPLAAGGEMSRCKAEMREATYGCRLSWLSDRW